MRVLLISHTCQSQTEGQPRAQCLGRMPELELCVLSPDRWMHYGQWRSPEIPEHAPFIYKTGKVLWPWVGPAQNYLHWYPRLATIIQQFQPDIIDIWEEPWAVVSAHACWLRRRLRPQAKIVLETECNIHKHFPPPFEQARPYVFAHSDFVVGRNAESIDVLRSHGYRGPAEVVPNAVDADLFRPLDRMACRRELGLTGFVAGYVGRLVEEKGLMDMVEALRLCSADVNLLFVGAGNFQAALERRVEELSKQDQVRFLPAQRLEDLPRVMNAIDVLVLASHTLATWKEQFGRVIIEAHACQTPVIGSTSGAIAEVIGAGGLVVPEHDPPALAAAINEMKADAEHRQQMGLAGYRQVHAHYTWQRVAERMRDIYLKVLH